MKKILFAILLFCSCSKAQQQFLGIQTYTAGPTLSLSTAFQNFNVTATWNNISADSYELQRAVSSDYSDAANIYTGTAFTYLNTDVPLFKTYYYRVRGITGGVNGSWTTNTLSNSAPSDGTTGATVYFFGNSITAGNGASDNAHRWTTLLSGAKSFTESNHGLSGYTITKQTACVIRPHWDYTTDDPIPTKTASLKYLFISFGVNDAFVNPGNTPSAYELTLDSAIQTAIDRGWNAKRIILNTLFFTNIDGTGVANYCNPTATDETRKQLFLTAAKNAAITKGCNTINIYDYMKNNGGVSLLNADNIHPNDTGHALIAAYIGSLLDQ